MLEIRSLSEAYLEDAAELVCGRVARLRQDVPELPAAYESTAAILPLLQDLVEEEQAGAAAFRNGRLAGFLAAWHVPSLHGVPSIFSPEWAHAAHDEQPARVYQALYRHLARSWVDDGYGTHFISLLPDEVDALRLWSWLGFGLFEIDAVRGLEPLPEPGIDVVIREAHAGDLQVVHALDQALWQHVRSAPVYLPIEAKEPEFLRQWIEDPQMHVLLAFAGDTPAAYLCIGPPNPDVCTLIFDPGTASIYRAYTTLIARRQGVASGLLQQALAVSRGQGYVRCAVDYESANPEAAGFWPRYFKPACYTLQRVIDPRFMLAQAGR